MDAGVVEALRQAPYLVIVLAFILYWSNRMEKSQQKRDDLMQKFWDTQRANDRNIMQELVDSVKALANKLDAHDEKVDERIDKARSKPPKGGSGW